MEFWEVNEVHFLFFVFLTHDDDEIWWSDLLKVCFLLHIYDYKIYWMYQDNFILIRIISFLHVEGTAYID